MFIILKDEDNGLKYTLKFVILEITFEIWKLKSYVHKIIFSYLFTYDMSNSVSQILFVQEVKIF